MGNVALHLLWREVAPVSRQGFRKLWGESATCRQRNEFVSAKHALVAWYMIVCLFCSQFIMVFMCIAFFFKREILFNVIISGWRQSL